LSGFGEVDEGKICARSARGRALAACAAGRIVWVLHACAAIASLKSFLEATFAHSQARPRHRYHRRGLSRGVKFSGLVTVGNCADATPSTRLFYLADDQTKVVGFTSTHKGREPLRRAW
jgi:hypothetical protein